MTSITNILIRFQVCVNRSGIWVVVMCDWKDKLPRRVLCPDKYMHNGKFFYRAVTNNCQDKRNDYRNSISTVMLRKANRLGRRERSLTDASDGAELESGPTTSSLSASMHWPLAMEV